MTIYRTLILIIYVFVNLGGAMSHDHREGRNGPPTWDGNPTMRRPFKDEVRIWTLGCDLEVKYCIAARLVRNLTGPARRAALTLKYDELLATDSNKKAGIENEMKKLQDTFGDDSVVRKGESLEEFFGKVTDSKDLLTGLPDGTRECTNLRRMASSCWQSRRYPVGFS